MLKYVNLVLLHCLIWSYSVNAWAQNSDSQFVLVTRRAEEHDKIARNIAHSFIEELQKRGIQAQNPPRLTKVTNKPEFASLYHEAEGAYENLHPEESLRMTRDILEEAPSFQDDEFSREALIRTLLLLALSAQALNDDETKNYAFDRLISINPNIEPDPVRYPPTLLDSLQSRKNLREQFSPSLLNVECPIESAEIFLDGQSLGPLSQHIEAESGYHLIHLSAPGYLTWGKTINLAPGVTNINVDLERDTQVQRALLNSPGLPGEAPTGLEEAARYLGFSLYLLDIVEKNGQMEVTLLDFGSNQTFNVASSVENAPESITPALLDAILHEEEDDSKISRKSRISWIVAGVTSGVVLVVAVVLSLVLTGSQESEVEGDWQLGWSR